MYQGIFFLKRASHGMGVGLFTKKSFQGKLFGEIYGEGLLHMMEELMIRSCQGREGAL